MGSGLRSLCLRVQHQPHGVLEMPAAAAELLSADTVVPHSQKVRFNSNQDKGSIFSGNEVSKYARSWPYSLSQMWEAVREAICIVQ